MRDASSRRTLIISVVAGLMVLILAACSSSVDKSEISLNKDSGGALLSKVQSSLKTIALVVKRSTMDLWWVSRDGYSIINDSSPAIEAQIPGCESDVSNSSMWQGTATKIIAAVDSVMSAENFAIEKETNSSKSLSDTKFYDYIKAYYRGSTKAVLSISPDCGSTSQADNPVMYYSASFGYTNGYQKNFDAQSPFLHDLKLKDVIVHIQKADGDFRLLAVNYRRSGHATIVKRIDGKWTELWSGQDLISCAIRNKFEIPISIAGDCYDY
jgi:hypothetical protein